MVLLGQGSGKIGGKDVRRPRQAGGGEEAGREVVPAIGEQGVDARLHGGIGRAAQGEGDRTEAELEQAVAALRLQVIVPLGGGSANELDLPLVEPEALVRRAALRIERAVVRQKDALRAAFDDGRRDRAAGDVGEALRREQDRDILLAKRLEPLTDARGEQRVIEKDPRLVEDEQRRPAVEAVLEAMEQVREDRRDDPQLRWDRRRGLHRFLPCRSTFRRARCPRQE